MVYIGYFSFFIVQIIALLTNKLYSKDAKTIFHNYVFSFGSSIVAMLFFAAKSGFHIGVNLPTLLYAAGYAAVVILSQWGMLYCLKYLSVAETNTFVSALTLLGTYLSGRLIFREQQSMISLVRCLLVIVAIFIAFVPQKQLSETPDDGRKTRRIGLWLTLLLGLMGVSGTVMLKFFSADARVCDDTSLFFWTNAIVLVFVVISCGGFLKNSGAKLKEISASVSPKSILWIVINTVASNVIALLSVVLLRISNVSLFAPVTGALDIMAASCISIFFMKEKAKPLPIALVLAALLLGIAE